MIFQEINSATQSAPKTQTGLTLIEMMVSLTVASLLSISVISAFTAQSSVFIKQTQRIQINDDGRQSFEVLSRLIQHSQAGTFNRNPIINASNTHLVFRFRVPAGFAIWPNLDSASVPKFDKNVIHIKWANYTNTSETPQAFKNQILIANTNSNATPINSEFDILAGMSTGVNTRISDFDIVKVGAQNLELKIETQSGGINDSKALFKGLVLPRN